MPAHTTNTLTPLTIRGHSVCQIVQPYCTLCQCPAIVEAQCITQIPSMNVYGVHLQHLQPASLVDSSTNAAAVTAYHRQLHHQRACVGTTAQRISPQCNRLYKQCKEHVEQCSHIAPSTTTTVAKSADGGGAAACAREASLI